MSQDFSWLGRFAPTPVEHPEQVLWTLAKSDEHVAKAIVKYMPYGNDLRVEVDGSLIQSRLVRTGEAGIDLEAAGWRSAFEERGWIRPE